MIRYKSTEDPLALNAQHIDGTKVTFDERIDLDKGQRVIDHLSSDRKLCCHYSAALNEYIIDALFYTEDKSPNTLTQSY